MVSKRSLTTLKGTELVRNEVPGELNPEVIPSISVTTTFRAQHPGSTGTEAAADLLNPSRHVYSRYTQPVRSQVERILGRINNGFALTYTSGLAAGYAALIFHRPKRVAITGGYHGCHDTLQLYQKSRHDDFTIIDLDDEYSEGDLCWLETPVNPTGESRDITYYANKVHAVGGKLLVDSTFAPPPLQYPFKWGADCVLHSGSKYFGGHSDLLSGILVVKTLEELEMLYHDRTHLGSVMGSLEAWLLLRSLKTLHLRVPRQSETATALVKWLHIISSTAAGNDYDEVPGGVITKVFHSSLQRRDARGFDPAQQMEGGWNATFAILLAKAVYSYRLPHVLKHFTPATSLGGVESLIEQRVQSDPNADPRILRISVGVEDLDDLKDDLRVGLRDIVVQFSSKL